MFSNAEDLKRLNRRPYLHQLLAAAVDAFRTRSLTFKRPTTDILSRSVMAVSKVRINRHLGQFQEKVRGQRPVYAAQPHFSTGVHTALFL